MSDINANIIVEPKEITISTTTNQLTVDASPINLNVFTGESIAGGQPGEIQYNAGGVLGGIPTAVYNAGNFTLGNTDTVKLYGGANAYFLQTDGTGNITWAPGTINANTGNGIPVGANKQIQITNGTGNFVSAPGFTFDNASNLFTAPGNAYIAGNTTVNNNLTVTNNTTIGGNATIAGNANIANNINITGNANVIGNVSANYLLGNGAFITGIDTTQLSNGNSNIKVYSNTINFKVNGNANVMTLGPTTDVSINGGLSVSGTSNFTGALTAGLAGINTPRITGSPVGNANSNIRLNVGGIEYRGASHVFYTPSNANFVLSLFPSFANFQVPVFGGNFNGTFFNGNYFVGNGYLLTAINAANIIGSLPNANFAEYSNIANTANTATYTYNVIGPTQSNITALGTLVSVNVAGYTRTGNLSISDNVVNNPTYEFVPNAINVVTQVGNKSYVSVTNLGNNSNKTNTAVIFGDNGLGSFVANNDSFANINGSNLFLATQQTNMLNANTSNKAASGALAWNVFGDNSDLANANVATATGLELNGTTGVAIVRGSPIDNSGVLATFSYGGNTDPTNSVGLRMTRRRGNGVVRQTLQPNDYIANIEWRGAQLNGGTPAGNRFAKIGAKVDSSYVANNSAQPVGLEFVVVNTTANITHNFYSNGVVNFANDVIIAGNSNISGIYYGNGSGLTSLTGANVTGTVANATFATSANIAGTVTTAAQPNITSVGNLTDLRINNTTIHLGSNSGLNQNTQAIAIGLNAGSNLQGEYTIAIGGNAGYSNQKLQAVAIGFQAGQNNQGFGAIAIGSLAGLDNQGNYSIAIGSGAGPSNLPSNTILLNASQQIVNATNANAFYVKPIRNASNANALMYNASTGEITYGAYAVSNINITSIPDSNITAVYPTFVYANGSQALYIDNLTASNGLPLVYNPQYAELIGGNLNFPTLRYGSQIISLYPGNTSAISFQANAVANVMVIQDTKVQVNKPLQSQVTTFGSLPSAVTIGTGARSFITDANNATFNQQVGAGGSNRVPVFSDGTVWRVG